MTTRRIRGARKGKVATLLRISDKLDQRVTKLSGGQMQRVAIGRALVRSPSIYLMDEPLSSLDAKLRAELRIELKRIQSELGATILYVTHDQTEAMTMGSQVGVIENGRLVQVGTPRQVYEDPSNIYVAARLGSPPINLAPRSVFPEIAMPENTATVLRPATGSGLSSRPKCRWGPSEGPVFPSCAITAPTFTASPTFTLRLPWRKCAYQAKTFGAISSITLLPP